MPGPLFLFGEPMSLIIYLDESGDLGWDFSRPYRSGGSSRFLTIGALCVPPGTKHFPKRVIKDLYDQFGWKPGTEKKWADMKPDERKEFAESAYKMSVAHDDIRLRAITVRKEKVMQHIRTDSNKLYNYMIGLSLLDVMAPHDEVTLVPDPRSIKVKSGNSLHDYLQIDLWFVKKVKTMLKTIPQDSQSCRGIQFTDMLCGVIRSHWEDGETQNYNVISPKVRQKCLFFR